MSEVKYRQSLEMRVMSQVIESALAVGYSLGVNDGEEVTLHHSRDAEEIKKALRTTDEDYLLVYNEEGKKIGWVYFVYGNDGWDVICDYTVNLENIMREACELADKLSE